MDIMKYTDHEITKNLALLENHLKQAQSGIDEVFCKDCINKHLILLEGLAEEGLNASGDSEKYKKVYNFVEETKNKDYRNRGIDFSEKARKIRKSLNDYCPECEEELGERNVKAIKELTKSLNNPHSSNNQLNKKIKNKMTDFTELGIMNAGQFAAEGVKYLVETQFPTAEPYASLGLGVGLQILPMVVRMPKWANSLLLVAGSNVLASSVVKLVKGTSGAAVPARASVVRAPSPTRSSGNQFNGRAFGGQVTAQHVPSQYARAGILKGAQAFEAPMHADLIRVD